MEDELDNEIKNNNSKNDDNKKDKKNDILALQEKYPPIKLEFCTICTLPIEFCSESHKVFVKKKLLIDPSKKQVQEDENNKVENKDDKENKEVKELQENIEKKVTFKDPIEKNSQKPLNNTNINDKVTEIEKNNTTNLNETGNEGNEEKKPKKQNKKNIKKVIIEQSKRKGKKFNTFISYLDLFNLNMKDVAKLLSKKFACSANVTKEDDNTECITMTGEFKFECKDFLLEKFPDILKPEDIQIL